MTEQPLVSVLMTSYNRERYIAESIESVLASIYTNFELIIVDDRSKDRTVEIAKSYEAKDSRIKVYVNEKNIGDYPNRNKAASYAKGKYIKYQDSDDLIYPHGLYVMVSSMEKFPEAAHGFPRYNMPYGPHPKQFSPKEMYIEHYLGRGMFNYAPNSIIMRKDKFEEVGGFSDDLKYINDFDMWLRLGKAYPAIAFPGEVVWGRLHDQQEGTHDFYKMENSYLVNHNHLINNQGLLTSDEQKKALQRIQQNFARTILRTFLIERKTKRAKHLYGLSKMKFRELLTGFKGYDYPKPLNY